MTAFSVITAAFSLVLLGLRLAHAEQSLWNPTTDPLPPLQPKEMGASTLNIQLYHDVDTNKIVLDINVPGYIFESYLYQSAMSVSGGSNQNVPVMQIAYDNYLDPSSPSSSLLAQYDGQTCLTSSIEGDSSYTGYDYYQTLLSGLSESGTPVYYEEFACSPYGTCLQYSAVVPWLNPALPRNITYTVIFQVSTGYLLEYAQHGTEYCCTDTASLYCPNSGLCNDGTTPRLTYANTTQYWSHYQIFSNSSWSDGFFGAYCPFTVCSSDDSDDHRASAIAIAFAVLFAVLFAISLLVHAAQYYKSRKARLLN